MIMDHFRNVHAGALDWVLPTLDSKQDRTQATISTALSSSTTSGPSQGHLHVKRKVSSPSSSSGDQLSSEDCNDNDDGSDSAKAGQPRKKGPGRRLLSEPDASDPRQKRKAQNRAAQRAFRERRQNYVKQLEDEIKDMRAKHTKDMQQLQEELSRQESLVRKLEEENHLLQSATFPLSIAEQPRSENEPANRSPLQEEPQQTTGSSPTPSAIDKNSLSFLDTNMTEYNFLNNTAGLQDRFQDIGQSSSVVEISTDTLVFSTIPNGQKGGQGVYHDSDRTRRAANWTVLWKKITEHPRYEDFDINDLLVKLKQRQEEFISKDGEIDMENLAAFLEQDFT